MLNLSNPWASSEYFHSVAVVLRDALQQLLNDVNADGLEVSPAVNNAKEVLKRYEDLESQ